MLDGLGVDGALAEGGVGDVGRRVDGGSLQGGRLELKHVPEVVVGEALGQHTAVVLPDRRLSLELTDLLLLADGVGVLSLLSAAEAEAQQREQGDHEEEDDSSAHCQHQDGLLRVQGACMRARACVCECVCVCVCMCRELTIILPPQPSRAEVPPSPYRGESPPEAGGAGLRP